MPATFQKITSISLAADASSVLISGIPQSFSDLFFYVSGQTTYLSMSNVAVRLNGDGATNYSYLALSSGTGSSSTYYNGQNQVWASIGNTTKPPSTFVLEGWICNYTASTTKQVISHCYGNTVCTTGAYYRGTSPITSLEFFTISGGTSIYGLTTGSTIDLFGIKNA